MKYIVTTLLIFGLLTTPVQGMTIQEQINQLYKLVAELQLQLDKLMQEEIKVEPKEEIVEPIVEPTEEPKIKETPKVETPTKETSVKETPKEKKPSKNRVRTWGIRFPAEA